MSHSRKTTTTSRTAPPPPAPPRHDLVGRDVVYQGHVWRVVASQEDQDAHGSPWLTLRRGGGIEAIAKSYELREALN